MRMASGNIASLRRALGIFRQQQLITAHAGEVVDVARLGHAHRGMNQKICLHLLRRAESQFHVGTMHRVAGLERNNPAPAAAEQIRLRNSAGVSRSG